MCAPRSANATAIGYLHAVWEAIPTELIASMTPPPPAPPPLPPPWTLAYYACLEAKRVAAEQALLANSTNATQAHEGIKHCERRNKDAFDIQQGARVGTDSCDLSNQFDHIIWAGDLNYRQEKREWWSTQEKYDTSAKADTVTHEEKLDQVRLRFDLF